MEFLKRIEILGIEKIIVNSNNFEILALGVHLILAKNE